MNINEDMSDSEDLDNDLMSAVIDEIALEGLDGITLDSLWIRLRVRFEIINGRPNSTLDFTSNSVQNFIFDHIIKGLADDKTISMYVLPENRPTIEIYNRYEFMNEETGTLIEDPDIIPEDVYGEVIPISDQHIKGSARYYYERTNVTKNVRNNKMSISDINNTYGSQKFVLVADQSRRTFALLSPYCSPDIDLSAIHYCILERIGRQRYLGDATIGKEAANYKLTPKTLFYYRKLLLKKKLIKKKQIIIYNKKTVQNSHGLVFTLNRFSTDSQTVFEINAKKISDLLKSRNMCMDYEEVKNHVNMKAKHFRELLRSYHTHFYILDSQERGRSSNKTNPNQIKRSIQLLKPIGEELDETDLNEENDDEEEVGVDGSKCQGLNVFNPGKIVADRTLLTQTLFIIESHESSEGIPLKEVGRCLSLPKLETRSLLRALEKLGFISTVMVDKGRQKVTLYVPKWRTEANQSFNRLSSNNSMTETNANFMKRSNLILEFVRKEQLVDRIYSLKQLIRESEKNNEHKVCTKTIVRIVQKLSTEGLVRSIRTFLKFKDRVKKLHFVCVPSITAEHPLIKEKISQIKFHWIGSCIDITTDNQTPIYSDVTPKNSKEKTPKNNIVMNLIYQPSIARKYGLEPKMKKIFTLYRFLFYLTHDFDKQNLSNTDWRYNIEPLPEGTQTKICTIGEIIPRMPLSVFVKIIWISHIIPGLQELIDDPVKVNLTLSQISPIILDCLRYKRKYVFNICESLVGLTFMGLVDTQYKEQTEREKTIITVKNKFSLRVNQIKTDFVINTMKDLQNFENIIQMHCFEPCNDCSLDKRLFAHTLRNWTYTPAYHHKTKNILASNQLQQISGINESTHNSNKQKENKKKRKQNSRHNLKDSKKAKTNETNVVNTNTEPIVNEKTTNQTPIHKNNIRKKIYDKIDLKARSLLKKQRSDWTPEEDSFLLICKVVSALLDPHCLHHICVNRNVIRDELHKYYPNVSTDKTTVACGRRITYMLKNPTTRQNVFDYIGEFKQQLNIRRPTVPKTKEQIWSDAYVKLLHEVLHRMQSSHQKNVDNRNNISINSFEDLLMRFNVVRAPTSVLPMRGRLYEDPNNVVDIHVNVVTNVLLSSLLSKQYLNQNNDKNEENWFSQTLFRIYQRFPDSLIRSVVTKLNKYGVMTKVKKTTKENLSSLKSKGNSPYRISQNFLFLMQTKYGLETLLLESKLNEDMICIKDGKTGFEAAIVTSLLASKTVRFQTEIPENIVVMENDCPIFTTARNALKNPKDPKAASRYALHLLRQHMKDNSSDRTQHSSDYLNINQCRITCSSTDPFIFNSNRFENIFKIQRQIFTNELSYKSEGLSSEDQRILDFILLKRELGVSVDDLLSIRTEDLLKESLKRLNERNLIYRVGIRNFRWVSVNYVNPWLVRSQLNHELSKRISNSDQNCVKYFARYWKQPNGEIDVRVVFKFLSAVLGYVMTNPCIPEDKLMEYFDQSLQPIQLLEILELLITSECVEVIESPQVLSPKLFDPKPYYSENKLKHYFSTADCLIRLYRLKEFFKI